MVLSKKEIIEVLLKNLEVLKQQYHVKHLFLFGSYMRNEAQKTSDIDLLVEYEQGYEKDLMNDLDLQTYLYNIFKKDIGLCEKNSIKEEYQVYINEQNMEAIC